jgi:uncharacterized protein YecE (DUF72 family)
MDAGTVRIGTSGWMYDDWRGRFYPAELPKRRWFEHYAARFDTVEVDSTFHRLPSPSAVDRWRDLAPEGFVFALKLGAFGSHRMKLNDAASWLPTHVDRVSRLGPTLGPTVVQLPPRWRRSVARLDEFLAVAGAAEPPMRWAVELREPSWVHDDVFDVLRRHGAALVLHDLLADHPVVVTTTWTYVRFHGPHALDERYVGRYGSRRLRPWAERIATWAADGVDVYAYFNNDVAGHAVADACTLRRQVEVRRAAPTVRSCRLRR